MRLTRRTFGSVVGASAALSFAPLVNLLASDRAAARSGLNFGPLSPQYPTNMSELPLARQGIAYLSLPNGFDYKVLSYYTQPMRDGSAVPASTDGMAAFPLRRGRVALVRNHELTTSVTPHVVPDGTYDPLVAGGTTTLIVDRDGNLTEQYGSLAGTDRNCSGGPTPWFSWLTCEEPLVIGDGDGVRHGYVFEVPAVGVSDAEPRVYLGRFNHEAVAVDPWTGIVYETEDRADSLFYRFVPAAYGDLSSPGKLQALQLLEWPNGVHTGRDFGAYANQPLAVGWVDIDEFDPPGDTVRFEGRSKGAARFSRGEGCCYGDGLIYFTCTDGGDLRAGQIFAYDPLRETLRLLVESTDHAVLDMPDNVVVHRDAGLYVCEDGDGRDNILRLDRDGTLAVVAQNNWSDSEWAGVCFAPNGRTMFANAQNDAVTFAIRGPFGGVALRRRAWSWGWGWR